MVRFVREQITTIRKQWPEVLNAGFKRAPEVYIAEREDARVSEHRHRLVEIADVEPANIQASIALDIRLDRLQRAAEVTFFERPKLFDRGKDMELIGGGRFGQSGEGIEDMELSAHETTHQGEIHRTAALKTTALHHCPGNAARDPQD